MVGMGLLMLLVSWVAAWQLWRRSLRRGLARVLVLMSFAGWVATLAGWYVTEIGRQPFLVYGVLRTAAAVTTAPVPVALSLGLYLTLYAALGVAYVSVVFYLARLAGRRSPDAPSKAVNAYA
jgi:cytochrome d ubiquinol oxidase subunit I